MRVSHIMRRARLIKERYIEEKKNSLEKERKRRKEEEAYDQSYWVDLTTYKPAFAPTTERRVSFRGCAECSEPGGRSFTKKFRDYFR
jgi:hypothetical protein